MLGDVTYGACCVDDLTAHALGCQLLVHYGHSCLVPLQHTAVACLYVFVEIQGVAVPHLVECLERTLLCCHQRSQKKKKKATSNNNNKQMQMQRKTPPFTCWARSSFATPWRPRRNCSRNGAGRRWKFPKSSRSARAKCWAARLPCCPQRKCVQQQVVCFVADGRFHLEATLIANPHIGRFYRYDPYSRTLTEEAYGMLFAYLYRATVVVWKEESYTFANTHVCFWSLIRLSPYFHTPVADHTQMHQLRQSAMQRARGARTFGVILGTLGRQGNPAIVQRLRAALDAAGKRHFLLLLSEITPAKLQCLEQHSTVDAWVQVACPRLSVDWGHHLSPANKPVLSSYECMVCLDDDAAGDYRSNNKNYPMDYYSQTGGPWSNYHGSNRDRQLHATAAAATTTTTIGKPKNDAKEEGEE